MIYWLTDNCTNIANLSTITTLLPFLSNANSYNNSTIQPF